MYSWAPVERSSSASSSVRPSGTYPPSGSWALVWSVTTSGSNPRASNSGKTSAAFPSRPIDTASPDSRASDVHRTASSSELVSRSR